MPGANERALEKAKAITADALILDLEDAVAPDAKPDARAKAVAAVQSGLYGNRELTIRCNGLDTPWGSDDVTAAARRECADPRGCGRRLVGLYAPAARRRASSSPLSICIYATPPAT
jgi:hypothetical protein